MTGLRQTAWAMACLAGLAGLISPAASRPPEEARLAGTLSVFFREEKVGVEEFSWSEEADGYTLRVTGRMTKPLRLDIDSMTLVVSKDFIPREYRFLGALNGMSQDISSRIQDGRVENTIRMAGQENVLTADVRRNAILLPNPLFSPYLVLAKKFGCGLKDKAEVSVYLIPQVEITGTLQAAPDNPCALTLDLAGVQVSLLVDGTGRLVSLSIPGQSLKVTFDYGQE
ncbi:MAG: hypothetical protein A2Y56_02390 [Candidatus Aminicenantes bacterium RBG_13_63_10]|nr:MAG: hypothetical protein A2Y56_02390 [Candidatus Aminicenantes bacterium RBG_13_63_10]